MTSRIIHSGLLRTSPESPELRNASTILSRLSSIFLRCCDVSVTTGARSSSASLSTSRRRSSSRTAGAPMSARNAASPSSFAFVRSVEVLVFVEQLVVLDFLLARLDDDVVRVVDDLLEITQRDVEQVAHRARQRLEEPDVGDGYGELDVPHALAAHLARGSLRRRSDRRSRRDSGCACTCRNGTPSP